MIPVNEDLIVNAVQKVSRSVVNIASVRTIHDEQFRVFPVEGVGSCVIIDERCHVLTNNHVVDDARRLKITLTDGSIFDGKVIGTDDTTDLAVVKLDSDAETELDETMILRGFFMLSAYCLFAFYHILTS
jgi:serine protease Do